MMKFKQLKPVLLILLFSFFSCELSNEESISTLTDSEILAEAMSEFEDNDESENQGDEDGENSDAENDNTESDDENNDDESQDEGNEDGRNNDEENDDNQSEGEEENEDQSNEDDENSGGDDGGDENSDDEDDNGDDESENQGNTDENPIEQDIDCTVFDGVVVVRNGRAAGVRTIKLDIEPGSVEWTLNGSPITPRTPRIVLLSDHIDTNEAQTVELCYRATSTTCGVLEGCATINF